MFSILTVFGLILALIYFIIAQRVLDKMHLSETQALAVVLSLFLGTLIDISVAGIAFNVGGVIAIGLAIYVLYRADTKVEQLRAVTTAAITAAIIYLYPVMLGIGEPGLDLLYWQGPIAGTVAYVLGRSRRAAFAGGVLAVLVLDVAHLFTARAAGMPGTIIAGGGAFDAIVLAGISGAAFAEIIGEVAEKLYRGTKGGDDQ